MSERATLVDFKSLLPGMGNPEVVKWLEELLELAKTGELSGVAVAAINHHGIAMQNFYADHQAVMALGGAISVMQANYLDHLEPI